MCSLVQDFSLEICDFNATWHQIEKIILSSDENLLSIKYVDDENFNLNKWFKKKYYDSNVVTQFMRPVSHFVTFRKHDNTSCSADTLIETAQGSKPRM